MGDTVEVLRHHRYSTDKTSVIRQALAGYVGGSATASEMVQNADDARASEISFHFHTDLLAVRNNSVFTEQDFDNITNIARGDKRAEENKIGTWGTGFLSVFHLTDAPELLSAGERIVFDPTRDELPGYRYIAAVEGTEFRLPWRRQMTELGHRLESSVWDNEKIQRLKEEMATTIYRLVIFLRHVRIIEVYEGDVDEKLLYRVERRQMETQHQPNFTREWWEIEYRRFGTQARTDKWLYYRSQIPRVPLVEGVKDFEIVLAFPLENRDWLADNVPGVLYNFLPIPIKTSYAFQINGAFFPDNNRRSILTDLSTYRERGGWNRRVLEALGSLFAEAILDIRDQVQEPRRFYELLPITSPAQDFLCPVHNTFIEAAPTLPIVFTTLGRWQRPEEVFVGMPGSRLPELAADYLPVLPTGTPQGFRDFLTETLRVRRLAWENVVEYLQSELRAGQSLAEAHQMVNSREKLQRLYSALPSSPTSEQQMVLKKTPLCLAEGETLWPFGDGIWQADEDTRQLLSDTGIRFIDAEIQAQFPKLLDSLVRKLRGADLVNWLDRQSWSTAPFSLATAPPIIGDADHLARLLHFIHDDLRNVNAQILTRLPLVRTENDQLCCAAGVYLHGDAEERATLRNFGLAFVHPDWAGDESIRLVYRGAGVEELRPRHVIAAIQAHPLDQSKLSHEGIVKRLLGLYGYFVRNSRQLSQDDKEQLRCLPICLTQQRRLMPARGRDTLYLPPIRNLEDSHLLAHLDNLHLDNLIHGDSRTADGNRFLTEVLSLEALSPSKLIRTVILLYYGDNRLNDAARQDLLRYISEQMRNLGDREQQELWPKLSEAQLVYCDDGEYRRGREVYFASPALDTVFATGYHRLHPDYGVPVAQPGDTEQAPYRRNTWYWLFECLGVNEHPAPDDLVRAVKLAVTAGPPTVERVEAVRRVYTLLYNEVGHRYQMNDPVLRCLGVTAWLPASNDTSQWFRPNKIYRASLIELIGTQGPLLQFREPTAELRELLDLPLEPSVELVIAHLKVSALGNEAVSRRVYEFLAQRATTPNQLKALRNEKIVWDNIRKCYWSPSQVFLGDYNRQFGHRRCYLSPPGGDAQSFLKNVGVREHPDNWDDHIALLKEIAADYADGDQVSKEDRQLLLTNFDHLGRQPPTSDDKSRDRVQPLRQLMIIPGRDGRLHVPNRIVLDARRELLEQFDEDAFPIVEEEELTESGYRLLRALGLPRLGEIVHRDPVDVKVSREDETLSLRLRQLVPAFRRIALTLHEGQGSHSHGDSPEERLARVRLRTCTNLVVEYVLDDRHGWRVQGHRHSEPALCHSHNESNFLYVRQTDPDSFPYVPLARELERILFPDSKESVVIEQLLRMSPAEVDRYLDDHGYRSLHQESLTPPDEKGTGGGLSDLGETNGGPAPWKPELPKLEPPVSPSPGSLPDFREVKPKAPVSVPDVPSPPPREKEPVVKIPPFTGQRRPAVPILPNDYGELIKKLGLKPPDRQSEIEISNGDSVNADTEWPPDKQDDEKRDVGRVSRVRFTLTFTNRYEGFLPLHPRARQMLADQPRRLDCHTDFEEWKFELYVDYDQSLIYNQEKLPAFFDAYNIPAGGIVYLERVQTDTVRLFWKPMSSRVENVRCLELLEDGTLDEYEIPAAKFPCEISEYVLRAEKRLEDLEALFRQALDKRGVFQTICEVFGAPGRELSYDDIYSGVMAQRKVAKASIDYQLSKRPCFVSAGDNRWRFEPEKGSEPEQTRHNTTSLAPIPPPRPTPDESDAVTTPYHRLLGWLRPEYETLSNLLQPDSHDLPQQLQRLAQHLAALAQRLQNDLAALTQTESRPDDQLTCLWQTLKGQPGNKQAEQSFVRYLQQQAIRGSSEGLLAQVRRQLADTPPEQRRYVFFPLLSRLAEFAENEHIELAREVYQLLQQQGAGDFQSQLERLSQVDEIQEYIELAQIAETPAEKWEVWQGAWGKYSGHPKLRRAIQEEIKSTVTELKQEVDDCLGRHEVYRAFNTYAEWMTHVGPLADAWYTAQEVTPLAWGLARRLFDALIAQARDGDNVKAYRLALELAATLPMDAHRQLSANDYLEAIQWLSKHLEEGDVIAAVALMEYGLHVVESKRQPADHYIAYQCHEYASRLYEHLNLFGRAYDHLQLAQRNVSTNNRKTELSRRLHELNDKRRKADSEKTMRDWKVQAEALLNRPEFSKLVRVSEFVEVASDSQ